MNADHFVLSQRNLTHAVRSGAWAHVLIWVLMTVAALLLVGFIAVVDDTTQRGELRHAQQRASGSLILPNELPARGVEVSDLLTMIGKKLAGH